MTTERTGANRRHVLGMLLGASGAALSGGRAFAAYPEQAITGVVPFAPGGGPDIFARLVSTQLSGLVGKPVVIANRTGGGGNVGIQSVLAAKPDGYTLIFNGVAMVMNPSIYRNINYDPVKDVQPIAGLAQSPFAVAVNTDRIQTKDIKEFIALIKKDPGKYNAASGGSSGTVGASLFMQQNDFKTQIVSYRGTGDAAAALIRGEADYLVTDPSALEAGLSTGKLRLLVIAGRERMAGYPDIPTTAEAGIPAFQVVNVYGVYARSDTPAEIIKYLSGQLIKTVDNPEIQARFKSLNWGVLKMQSEEHTAFYRAEVAKWKDVVAKANIPLMD
jgi:tripartite-type tricarboxylate transporter receptor subunit TctC